MRQISIVLFLAVTANICLAVPVGLPGDYNDDGVVNEADYVVWRNAHGSLDPLPNDPIGGTISVQQYDQWKANYGTTVGAGPPPSQGTPAMQVVKGGTQANGHLNSAGNWLWKVQIAPSNPVPHGNSPLAASIGFSENATHAQLLQATNLSFGAGDKFETNNPGHVIFGWETTQDVDPGAGVNPRPVGLQVSGAHNQVFSALGSAGFNSTGFKDYISIEILGPCVDDGSPGSSCAAGDRLTTTIQWLGAYSGKGRIAELAPSGSPTSLNYDLYAGSVTRSAIPGDANLDGVVDGTDYITWLSNVGSSNTRWQDGDFNDDNIVDTADLYILQVPEPTGAMLVILTAATLTWRRNRLIG
jgi:hypothetical protein